MTNSWNLCMFGDEWCDFLLEYGREGEINACEMGFTPSSCPDIKKYHSEYSRSSFEDSSCFDCVRRGKCNLHGHCFFNSSVDDIF